MKKTYFIVFLILLTFCKRDFSNRVPIYLVIYSEDIYNDSICLWVNDTIIYNGRFKPGYKSRYDIFMLVGHIPKDSITKRIRIKADTQDTTFMYKQKECMDYVTIRYYPYLYPNYVPYIFSIDTIKYGYE